MKMKRKWIWRVPNSNLEEWFGMKIELPEILHTVVLVSSG